MTKPKHNINFDRALDLLAEEQQLIDFYIEGKIDLSLLDTFDKAVVIDNCIIEDFNGTNVAFSKSVRLINSKFINCNFSLVYFLGGLTIENCVFEHYLNFQAGGHNKTGQNILITNSMFKEFVNFFDCYYEGPVTIEGNDFLRGTNLIGNQGKSFATSFEITPTINNNKGKIDLDGEGEEL